MLWHPVSWESWEFRVPGMWAHRLSPAFPGLVLEAAYSLSPSASLHLELWGLTYGSPWSWGAPGAPQGRSFIQQMGRPFLNLRVGLWEVFIPGLIPG